MKSLIERVVEIAFLICVALCMSEALAEMPSTTQQFHPGPDMVLVDKDGTLLVYERRNQVADFPTEAGVVSIQHICSSLTPGDTIYTAMFVYLRPDVRPMTPEWSWWISRMYRDYGAPFSTAEACPIWNTEQNTITSICPGGFFGDGALGLVTVIPRIP